jgi:hypothetical protein
VHGSDRQLRTAVHSKRADSQLLFGKVALHQPLIPRLIWIQTDIRVRN